MSKKICGRCARSFDDEQNCPDCGASPREMEDGELTPEEELLLLGLL